jgi:DNA-binding beta-propeller fold protein YncE
MGTWHRRVRRGTVGTVIGAAILAVAPALAGAESPASTAGKRANVREVLYVANNWDGTADVVDPRRFRRLMRINIIPDRVQRLAEINADPDRAFAFQGIRTLVGEGHDQYVDDMFSSHDGREIYVSRPSFADVVAIDLRTRRIRWRTPVGGVRADHMAISPDGRRLAVSASTANIVAIIDTRAGRIVARIPSGDSPHENNYSRDGRLIYHASIGRVYTDLDDPSEDSTKGERYFQIIDARRNRVIKRIDMGKEMAKFGMQTSSAVRPMALSPDERFVYFQLSFLHGFVEYDLKRMRPLRVAMLPVAPAVQRMRRQDYLLDSAHHGLAMNPQGTKLCAAGTMSDYAAIVHRRTLRPQRIINVGRKPYWSTNSGDGRYCFVSVSGDDRVSVISYRTAREVARIRVGDHPQRMRMGFIQRSLVR